jgi:hypothetical protein
VVIIISKFDRLVVITCSNRIVAIFVAILIVNSTTQNTLNLRRFSPRLLKV